MVTSGSECSVLSPILNEPQGPDGPLTQPGDRVSPGLGLGGPQTPALWCQAPWEGHLGGRPMVSVSPQEVHRRELTAVGRAEWQAKMRMLGWGVWAQGFCHGHLQILPGAHNTLPFLPP